MADENINIDIQVNGFTSMKAQIREAQLAYEALLQDINATPEAVAAAASKVGQLRDEFNDAKDSANALGSSAGKFQAVAKSLSVVAGGFSAIQGAMALAGGTGKEFEQTMIKLQGAMALTQGLTALADAKDAFNNLGIVAVDAFKGIKAAIGSTGIGLLVIALGTIVVYWDDIKEAVTGVSAEQKKLNEEIEKQVKKSDDNLKTLDQQEITLRRQGLSEKEIRDWKIKQYEINIALKKQALENAIITEQASLQVKKNFSDILNSGFFDEGGKIAKFFDKYLPESITKAAKEVSENNKKLAKTGPEIVNYAKDALTVSQKDLDESKARIKVYQDDLAKVQNDLYLYQQDIKDKDKKSADAATEEAKKKLKEKYDNEIEASRQKNQKLVDDAKIAGEDGLAQEKILLEDKLAIEQKYNSQFKQYGENLETEIFDTKEAIRLKQDSINDKQAEKDKKLAKETADALIVTAQQKGEAEILAEEDKYNKLIEAAKGDTQKVIALEKARDEKIKMMRTQLSKDLLDAEKKAIEERYQLEADAVDKSFEAAKLAALNKSQLILGDEKSTAEERLAAQKELENNLLNIEIDAIKQKIKIRQDLGLSTVELTKQLVDDLDKLYKKDEQSWGEKWLEKNKIALQQLDAIFTATQSILTAMQDLQNLSNLEDSERLKKASEDQMAVLTANAEAAIAVEGTTDAQKKKIRDDYNKAVTKAEYDRAKAEYGLAKDAFDNSKKLQIAQAIISTIQGAVQAFTSLVGIPVVGPILGGIAAAAALVSGYAQVETIRKTTYSGVPPKDPSSYLNQSDSGGSSGSKFAQGGLLTGRKHSEGGIPTPFGQLEGGEYVVNRSATEAFMPLLDKINGMGQGSGAPNNLSVVGEQTVAQPTPIIKTYVVASDMSSQQEANKRLNDIARL
jgi:hypothetical protein